MKARLKSKIAWALAKLGNKLIALWMRDQYDIDGDWVQVDEILDEWRIETERQHTGFGKMVGI